MPIVLFNFARNLKITRFTIDVLTQRLEHPESPRDGTSKEIAGKDVPALVHFDRNGFGYTMDRRPGFPRRAPRTVRESTADFKARLRPEPFSAGFELHSDRRFDRRPRAIGECRGRRV